MRSSARAVVRSVVVVLALVGTGLSASTVLGQSAGVTGAWLTMPGTPGAPLTWLDTVTRTGTAANAGNAPTGSMVTNAQANGVLWLRLRGQAQHDGIGAADSFVYESTATGAGNGPSQLFLLKEPSRVYAPVFARGAFDFLGAGNAATGRLRVSVTLSREATAGADDWANISTIEITPGGAPPGQNFTGPGGNFVNLFNLADFGNLNPGAGAANLGRRYRMDYTVRLEGNASAGGSAVGSSVDANFNTERQDGFVFSTAFVPQGFNLDGRAKVRAEAARQAYNVTGAGIRVGVLETGEMYGDNQTVSFGRIDSIRGNLDAANKDFRREHPTFVASIIGSDAADLDKQGIARGVHFDAAPLLSYGAGTSPTAVQNLIDRGARVINMSAFDSELTQAVLDQRITGSMNGAGTRDVTFVVAAGNDGAPVGAGDTTISVSGKSFNAITVGALNRDFTRRAEFSAYNNSDLGNGTKHVDIVAPGEYIQGANMKDLNNDSVIDQRDYSRIFLGADYANEGRAATNDISGTSFSTPMVSGAAALLHELGDRKGYEADHRVIKAVLQGGAQIRGISRSDASGAATIPWEQRTDMVGGALRVRRSMDRQLGAGLLDAKQSLRIYDGGEVNASDNNTQQARVHDASALTPVATITGDTSPGWWDREQVAAKAGATEGWVDYKLGDIQNMGFRAALAWDFDSTRGVIPQLEMELFARTFTSGDTLIAFTQSMSGDENVKLFDLWVPTLVLGGEDVFDSYYLRIRNLETFSVTYGLAVVVPTPGGLSVLLAVGVVAARRRRTGR